MVPLKTFKVTAFINSRRNQRKGRMSQYSPQLKVICWRGPRLVDRCLREYSLNKPAPSAVTRAVHICVAVLPSPNGGTKQCCFFELPAQIRPSLVQVAEIEEQRRKDVEEQRQVTAGTTTVSPTQSSDPQTPAKASDSSKVHTRSYHPACP
ncbi:hypothetical protein C8Q80DRAFT_1272361 [Daedaleopsis nitida]|nr:hypothetical protein C8Q80DRAFT_1272361 [Daedaleopsis nitida]